jgi:hypothetical protein
MSQMLKSSGAMAAATLTSRLLGVVREMVYAAFMGNSWVAGAFQLAFQVPNLFRRLLGEGALTAAFIPIFKQKEVKEGEAEMWRSANAVISGLVTAAAAVTVLAVLAISIALADAGALADNVPLHAAGVPGRRADRHGQRAGSLLRAGIGRGVAERGHDRQRAVDRPTHGPDLGNPNSRPCHRCGAGRLGTGFFSTAQPSTRRLRL